MAKSEENNLLTLLFGSGRTLVNCKFLPGDNATSGEALCETAYRWLSKSLSQDGPNDIPGNGREQVHYGELLAQG